MARVTRITCYLDFVQGCIGECIGGGKDKKYHIRENKQYNFTDHKNFIIIKWH